MVRRIREIGGIFADGFGVGRAVEAGWCKNTTKPAYRSPTLRLYPPQQATLHAASVAGNLHSYPQPFFRPPLTVNVRTRRRIRAISSNINYSALPGPVSNSSTSFPLSLHPHPHSRLLAGPQAQLPPTWRPSPEPHLSIPTVACGWRAHVLWGV